MKLLDRILGREPERPPLAEDSPEAGRLAAQAPQIETIAGETGTRVEVLPEESATYVLVGQPPGAFGIAWIRDGNVYNLKDVVKERGVSPVKVERVVEDVRVTYKKTRDAPRFRARVREHEVIVARAPELGEAIGKVIDELAA